MSNYPPGVSAGTPGAPWNEPEPIECLECGGIYADDGHEPIEDAPMRCHDCDHEGFDLGHFSMDLGCEVCPECGSEDIQHELCPNAGMNAADYEEAEHAHHAEMKMEARREEQ